MEQDMTLRKIVNTLETKGFFKFTAKIINENNIDYTFKSFRWNNMMTIKISVIKFQKQKFIRHITINNTKTIKNIEDFNKFMNNLYQIHKTIKEKKLNHARKNKHNNNSNHCNHHTRTNND